MMARSTKRSNQRPDTLMQDRISPNSNKSSCNARPYHTFGSRADVASSHIHVRFTLKADKAQTCWHGRFVPISDIEEPPRQQSLRLRDRCGLLPLDRSWATVVCSAQTVRCNVR